MTKTEQKSEVVIVEKSHRSRAKVWSCTVSELIESAWSDEGSFLHIAEHWPEVADAGPSHEDAYEAATEALGSDLSSFTVYDSLADAKSDRFYEAAEKIGWLIQSLIEEEAKSKERKRGNKPIFRIRYRHPNESVVRTVYSYRRINPHSAGREVVSVENTDLSIDDVFAIRRQYQDDGSIGPEIDGYPRGQQFPGCPQSFD